MPDGRCEVLRDLITIQLAPRLGAHGGRAGGYSPAMGQTRNRKLNAILWKVVMSL